MIYVETDNNRASFNFALEEYLMKEKKLPCREILLLWCTRKTVMVGRFQNTYEEVNIEYAMKNRIDIVRRNSGGGTIYTDEGALQFSFIVKDCNPDKMSFTSFTEPVIKALLKIGVKAEFNSRNDLVSCGRKISGNAQYVSSKSLIHHGSLLWNTDMDCLSDVLEVDSRKYESKGIKSVKSRVANIADIIKENKGDNVSFDDFRNILKSEILSNNASVYQLDENDIRRVEEIENEKFRSWEWTYKKSPEFNVLKSTKLPGGLFNVKLNIADGYIKSCSIEGDFFTRSDIEDVEKYLEGTKYVKDELERVVEEKKLYDVFKMIDKNEFIKCLI